MNEPMPKPPSGASHQKRGCRNTGARPRTARAGRPNAPACRCRGRATRWQRHHEGHQRERDEHHAPVGDAQRELERHRRGQRADAARHHHPARVGRLAVGADTTRRSPSAAPSGTRTRRRRSPRAPARARPATRPARTAPRRWRRRQEHRLDAPRPVAVEQDAHRHLHRREREEVRAREQAERGRIERQVAHELRRDHRVDRAEQVRQQVGRREREVDARKCTAAIIADPRSRASWGCAAGSCRSRTRPPRLRSNRPHPQAVSTPPPRSGRAPGRPRSAGGRRTGRPDARDLRAGTPLRARDGPRCSLDGRAAGRCTRATPKGP